MGTEDEELERLRRIREQQIARRNPRNREKDRRLHANISRKIQNSRRVSLGQIWREMPAKVLYMIIGFIFGLAIGMTLLILFQSSLWSQVGALIAILVFTLVGRVVGMAEDFRRE